MSDRFLPTLSEIAATPTFTTIDGLSIRFAESEWRNADALLLSPWPESVFAYEPVWSHLAETTHVPGSPRMRPTGSPECEELFPVQVVERRARAGDVKRAIPSSDCRGFTTLNIVR